MDMIGSREALRKSDMAVRSPNEMKVLMETKIIELYINCSRCFVPVAMFDHQKVVQRYHTQNGGFHTWDYPNSWMVYNGKSIYKWMIWESLEPFLEISTRNVIKWRFPPQMEVPQFIWGYLR